MKGLSKVFAAAAILAAVTVAFAASRRAVAQPAAPAAGAVPAGKVALIDTEAFTDQKTGVARIVAAFNAVEREFKPRRDELQTMQTRRDALLRELGAPPAGADRRALAAKADEAERLKTDIERKQQDGQRNYERRFKELTDPIFVDLNKSLRDYARQRDVAVVMDISKLAGAVMVVNDAINITDAFVADYNRRNPAPAPAPAAPARP
ncbi:MAG: OmpH family outer membrane protein [Acidobacteria bacterium]|nr:OmpH family outer membrane protein [Acidobacteriota bacterium]